MTPARERNRKGAGDRLRPEILSAAASLVAEGGADALSLRAIARRAGVTAPAIYAHFKDIDAVRNAVVAETFSELADWLARGAQDRTDPVDRLRATCRAYVDYGFRNPRQYAILFSTPFELPDLESPKSLATMQGGNAFAILLDAIKACVDAGRSRSTRIEDDAAAVWLALHGYVSLTAALPDFPWPPTDTLLDNMIDRLAQLS